MSYDEDEIEWEGMLDMCQKIWERNVRPKLAYLGIVDLDKTTKLIEECYFRVVIYFVNSPRHMEGNSCPVFMTCDVCKRSFSYPYKLMYHCNGCSATETPTGSEGTEGVGYDICGHCIKKVLNQHVNHEKTCDYLITQYNRYYSAYFEMSDSEKNKHIWDRCVLPQLTMMNPVDLAGVISMYEECPERAQLYFFLILNQHTGRFVVPCIFCNVCKKRYAHPYAHIYHCSCMIEGSEYSNYDICANCAEEELPKHADHTNEYNYLYIIFRKYYGSAAILDHIALQKHVSEEGSENSNSGSGANSV